MDSLEKGGPRRSVRMYLDCSLAAESVQGEGEAVTPQWVAGSPGWSTVSRSPGLGEVPASML